MSKPRIYSNQPGSLCVSIHKRLTNMGYSEADMSTNLDERGWKWTELVNKPKELTERGMVLRLDDCASS